MILICTLGIDQRVSVGGKPLNLLNWSFFCAAESIAFLKEGIGAMHEMDFEIAQRALNGDAKAANEIEGRRAMLERILVSCGARSRSEACDLVADVLGECFGARNRTRAASTDHILKEYRGQCSLDSWLITVCRNRLRDFVSSAGESRVERDSPYQAVASDELAIEPEILSLLRDSLVEAMSRLEPLTLIFLRLVYLHGVTQREVAAAWHCHESKVSRMLKEGSETLKTETIARLKLRDSHFQLEWRDLIALCEAAPQLLHGR